MKKKLAGLFAAMALMSSSSGAMADIDWHKHTPCMEDPNGYYAGCHEEIVYDPWDGSKLQLEEGETYSYYLTKDVDYMPYTLMVPEGTTLNLCFNGHQLNMGNSSPAAQTLAMDVSGELTLSNCLGGGEADKILCQFADEPAIHIREGGQTTLFRDCGIMRHIGSPCIKNEGVFMMDQAFDAHVGGFYGNACAVENLGTMVMNEGAIGNALTGIHNKGVLTLNGGYINSDEVGVCNEGSLTINMFDLMAGEKGVDQISGTLNIGDGFLDLNNCPANIYLHDGQKIRFPGAMNINARIGVTHEKQADGVSPIDFLTAEQGVTDTMLSRITSDDSRYAIRVKPGDNKTAQLYRAFTITYDLAGGALPEGAENPTSYQDTDESFTLINPVREGFTFAGWTGTQLTAPVVNLTIGKGSTGDLAFTATWTAKTFEISAKAEGPGRVEGAGVYGYGDTVTLTAVPDAGAAFVGWSEDMASAQGGESPVLSFIATQNRELIAKFRHLNLPVFTKHPQSVTVRVGESAVFSAEAECEAPMVICWEADRGDGRGFVSVGCGNRAYTLPAAKLSDSGMRIRCVATAADGTAISKVAVLTVVPVTPINPDDLPKTGDTQNLAFWCALATIAAMAALVLRRKEV